MKTLLTYLLMLVSALSCSSQESHLNKVAYTILTSPASKELLVNVKFKQVPKGVAVHVQARGLRPGSVHGLHVHEIGKCEGDFKSAGGHFNPENYPHAGPAAEVRHLGDLGNLVANAKGEAVTEILMRNDKFNLDSLVGKSVILHAAADDLFSQPSGNSGSRMSCGIITHSLK